MRISSVVLGVILVLSMVYFSYEIIFVFPKITTAAALFMNYILISAEILCAMFSIYLYHSVFCSMEWKSIKYRGLKKHPFVTIHVPIYNEPIEVVKKTLAATMNQDYPRNRYEIIVADDSTDEKKLNVIKKFCEKNKIRYVHRNHRKGFKAGALNGIESISKGEFIALLDADDKPEATFLSHSIEAIMADEKIAFIQTRNAERNDGINAITGIGRMMRDLFFGSILKSKDMRNLTIFCGSGGVIRKSALKACNGWPEETVTEDIDLSTKLFSMGYTSKFINPVECKGLLPQTFSGLAGQVSRWSHGTTRTLMLRWKLILKIPGFWRKLEHFLSCMTYMLGPAILLIDFIMVAHLLLKIPIFHIYEPTTLWIFGIGFTLSSFIALLYVQMLDKRISMKRIFYYIFAIYGLSVTFTAAAARAILGKKFTFIRTERSGKGLSMKKIIKKFWLESVIGIVSIYAGIISLSNPIYNVQGVWVIFFGIGFLTAPLLAIKYR